jgi:hypothetical protein
VGNITIMPQRAYLIFGEIEGKLDVRAGLHRAGRERSRPSA